MTHKRFTYLLIFIISILLNLSILLAVSRAESDFSWHAGGYVTGDFASGAGYSPGVGILAEAQGRWKFLELKVGASTAWQKKKRASFGYTWSGSAQLRGFFYKDFYAVGAYGIAGYESRFDSGAIWRKHGDNVGFGLGWETDYIDLNLITYLKENSSPNKVAYTSLSVRYRMWEYIWAMGSVKRMTYDQMTSTGMERWDALNMTVGIGVRW